MAWQIKSIFKKGTKNLIHRRKKTTQDEKQRL